MRLSTSALVLSTALLASVAGHAQNYRPFGPGRTYHYQEDLTAGKSRGYLFVVDSVYVRGSDSVFCFNPTGTWLWHPSRYERMNLNGAQFSWQAASGQATFVGAHGTDTVQVLTRAAIGQTWAFNRTVQATLVSRQSESVASRPDTVLTIGLSDGQTLKISRSYGIIAGPALFFYLGSQYNASGLKLLTLAAIPELQLGTLDLGRRAIFAIQPGDRFYYRSKDRISSSCTSGWLCREAIAVRANGDSVLYRAKSMSGPCGGSLSQAITGSGWQRYDRQGYMLTASWRTLLALNTGPALTDPDSVGGRPQIAQAINGAQGYFYSRTYAMGLGEVQYYSTSLSSTGVRSSYQQRLVGYIKGTEVWGDTTSPRPLAVADDARRLPATLAPNPSGADAEPLLTFSTEQPQAATLVLYDALGREAWRREAQLSAGEQRLAVGVNTLAPGLYRLRLTLADGRQRVLPLVRQ